MKIILPTFFTRLAFSTALNEGCATTKNSFNTRGMNRVSKIFQPSLVVPKNAVVKNHDLTSNSQKVKRKHLDNLFHDVYC